MYGVLRIEFPIFLGPLSASVSEIVTSVSVTVKNLNLVVPQHKYYTIRSRLLHHLLLYESNIFSFKTR